MARAPVGAGPTWASLTTSPSAVTPTTASAVALSTPRTTINRVRGVPDRRQPTLGEGERPWESSPAGAPAPAKRRAAVAASVFGIAVFGVGAGVAVSGCGSDNNSNDVSSVNNAIDSVQSQASSVQSQVSSITTQAQQQVQSVQSQVQSVQARSPRPSPAVATAATACR